MRDTSKYRSELIEYLEKALLLAEQASKSNVDYLIERAMDEVGTSQVESMPKPKSSTLQCRVTAIMEYFNPAFAP